MEVLELIPLIDLSQIKHLATKTDSADWWQLELADLGLHNNIWFNTMRVFKSYKSRKGSDNHDHVLDNLIQLGLIDRNKEEVTPAIQQFLRYPAIMADRLTKSHNDLVRQVGWLFIEVLILLTTTLVVRGV